MICGCQSGGDAAALFHQVNLRTWRQINPGTRAFPKPRDWDQFTMTASCKEDVSCGIKLHAWKAEVERFVSAQFVVADIGQIAEGHPRRQFAGLPVKVELVPDHFAVRECLRAIGTDNTDRARHYGNARRENSCQWDRESHASSLWTKRVLVQCAR